VPNGKPEAFRMGSGQAAKPFASKKAKLEQHL